MTGATLPDGRIPVLLSAHEADLIGVDAAAIGRYLDARSHPPDVAEIAAAVQTRPVRRHRAVVRARDAAELAAGLAALAGGDDHPLVATASPASAPRTAFVFPGQGSQWPAMGAEAYHDLPSYRAEADRCTAAFTAAGFPSPLPYLVDGGPRQRPQSVIQAAHFTHLAGLAKAWRSCGIHPDIVVGHSLGEVAGAYVAGTVTLADAVGVVAARVTVIDALPGRYGMAVLGVGAAEAERLAAEIPGHLEVSVVNAPSSTALSGDRDAAAAVVRRAEARGIFVREIAVGFPAHTSALDPLRAGLQRLLPAAAFTDASVEFIGAATGDVVAAGTEFTGYWYENLRRTVRFDRAVATAGRRGAGIFVEMSAHPSLKYSLTELADPAVIVGSGRRDRPVADELSANIAAAAVADPGHRWPGAAGEIGSPVLPGFPGAPMRARHLWASRRPRAGDAPAGPAIITAAERWQPLPVTPRQAGTRRSAAVVAPTGSEAAESLRHALATHPDCDPKPLGDAEIVVIVAPPLRHPDVAAAAADLRDRHRTELFDYRAIVGPNCRTVWLVTAGAERIGPDDAPALPAQAALAAMHRCVGLEFTDQTFAHLDLPADAFDAATARACADGLLDVTAAEVAVRGPARYTRTLHEPALSAPARPLNGAVPADVVITGGTGAVGGRYARYCIERGARKVVLLSRTGLDPTALAALADGHRVELTAPACDITDPEQLSAVAAAHVGDGASLLIHAAGAARFAPHHQVTADDLSAAFGAKVEGLARMAEIWPLRAEARILACSSISGVWGGHGHGAYSAANRMLDVLVDQLRAAGRDATAVRWGLWQGAGIVDAGEITRIERAGLLAMDPDRALPAGLRHYEYDPMIFGADAGRLRIFFENQNGSRDPGSDHAAPAPPRGELPAGEAVAAALADVLNLGAPEAVDLDAALIDLGVDSLLALDLRKRLHHSTGYAVPLARLLGGITANDLIAAAQTAKTETSERWASSHD